MFFLHRNLMQGTEDVLLYTNQMLCLFMRA